MIAAEQNLKRRIGTLEREIERLQRQRIMIDLGDLGDLTERPKIKFPDAGVATELTVREGRWTGPLWVASDCWTTLKGPRELVKP